MSFGVVIGIVLVLALIIGVGMASGRKVQDSKDFLSGGGRAGAFLVCGSILGSLVSSQATIGTAQLAFHYGLSAWWFTLGSGIGCLALGIGYAKRLRSSGCITEMQIIAKEYGSFSGSLGSILCSTGIFISVLAQAVACSGLITVLFPNISLAVAALISVALMCTYVVFGGAWGAGMGGVVKLLLLCFISAIGFVLVMWSSFGISGLLNGLVELFTQTGLGSVQNASAGLSNIADSGDVIQRYANLVARGAAKDIGSGFSLLLGVLSTQTYAQAIWSAKSNQAARRGALLCACLIPIIGICGISIGLFMRNHYILQSEVAALTAAGAAVPDLPVLESTIQVFPSFVLNHLPPLVAGVALGTLLITVVGGGAGLSLGMATILMKDILKKVSRKFDAPEKELTAVRVTITIILLAAACITIVVPNTVINDLGFLSMGLRGSVVFLPLSAALWLPGKIDKNCMIASIILAPCGVFAAKLANVAFDALFVGIFISALMCVVGYLKNKKSM